MFQLSKPSWWSNPRPKRRSFGTHSKNGRKLTVERLESREVPASWATMTVADNQLPGSVQGAMVLSDGSILLEGGGDGISNAWYKLTPNSSGSYANGTITTLASSNVQRLFFAQNMLPSGKVLVLGGEYGPNNTSDLNTGEIYDPVANTWTNITPFPQSNFGDDPTEMLPNGTVLAGYLVGTQTYIYNPTTNAWTQTGSKIHSDRSDEETWVKLPDGSILSYDVFGMSNGHNSAQRYVPSSGQWVDASGTNGVPVPLSSSAVGSELGPGFLLSDGRVLFIGATNNTALYTPSTNTWVAGPSMPTNVGADDAPGAELPNGHVLFAADTNSPDFTKPTRLFDFDPSTNTITDVTPTAPSSLANSLANSGAFIDRMLVLPNGDVMLLLSNSKMYEYTPDGGPTAGSQPVISNIVYNGNQVYTLTGTQLNGISEGASYGDDAEMSSNYPLVRLTSSNGTVYYARTFNWSSTGVQTGSTPVTTQFTPPANLPNGAYSLVVVANGIASATPTTPNFNFNAPIYVDNQFTTAHYPSGAITDADPVASGNQSATIGVNAFSTISAAINAAAAGGQVIVNGANGADTGIFSENVLVNKQVQIWLQEGPVSVGSMTGLVASSSVVLNVPLTDGTNNTNTEFDGAITGSSTFTKTGGGTLTLGGNESFTGTTTVSGGNLLVGGSLSSASAVTVAAGATLSGPGIIGGTTTVNGTLAPGNNVGDLTTGPVTFNAGGALSINIMGPTAGTNYSQVVATGPVNLNGATLTLSLASGFTPSANAPFDILVNQSGTAIAGTFANLPEGATFLADGQYFSITYHGGTGNDVVLTPTLPPAPANLVATTGSGTIGLSWDSVGGTATYNVYRGTAPGGESATPIATGLTSLNFTDSLLAYGTTYYYRVTATTAGVESQASNEASALADGPTFTALQVSPDPATPDQTVTLTATVTSNGGTPQIGSVRFFDDGSSIGTVPVDSTGTAVLQTMFALGSHSLTATYRGSLGFDSSTTTQAVTELVGPPTVASVQVNDGSAQRSEVQSITITFSGPVTFAGSGAVDDNAAAAFQLQHIQDATNVILSAVVSADSQNRTVVTLTFSGSEIDPLSVANNGIASLADGRYQLTILGANVTSANGLALDGAGTGTPGSNYVSPTDTQGGGPGQLQLYRLFGDATGDGTVDSQDLGQFRSTYNAGTGNSSYLAYLDADNSGFVDSQDLGQFRSRYNTSVF